MKPLVLDVRRMAPPEPMERILDTLADMPPEARLIVLHRREPFPLYDLLRRMGYAWRTQGGEDRYEILIWHTRFPPSADELDLDAPA